MRHFVDEFLCHVNIQIGNETETTALATDRVTNDLGLFDLTKLLEVRHEILIRQSIV